MISDKTRRIVYDRDGGRCVVCKKPRDLEATPHHCLFRSHYHLKDKDQPWNLVTICIDCHRNKVHGSDHDLRISLEAMALTRRIDA